MENPDKQIKKRILSDRAKLLAQRENASNPGESIEGVEFRLSNERYAIESTHVREVLPLKELTTVPCTPSYILGIINIRGQILSVIDLRIFFELPREAATYATKIIVLSSSEMELGIIADAVIGACSIPLARLHSDLPTLTGIRSAYLRGVVGSDLVLIDAGKLLADRSLIVDEEVEA